MRFSQQFSFIIAGVLLSASVAGAAEMSMANPMVGGHAMYASRNIVENAVNSDDNKTLVAAVKAAGLADTLQSKGPFTVFAPTDEAFSALPAGTVDTLLKPENHAQLVHVLTYHVVPGVYDYKKLALAIHRGGGTAELKTVDGEILTVKMNGPHNIVLIDTKGRVANISTYDVYQANGVINVVDKVLLP